MTSAVPWVVVLIIVGSLFLAPNSTGAAPVPLTVRPGADTYGGELITFSGDMGNGEQRIYLQRRGNLSAPWAGVVDPRNGRPFSMLTKANGEFTFTFPAPAMNAVYFRLWSRVAETEAHQFTTRHQDAELRVVEGNPADQPLPQTIAEGLAVGGEPFSISVDTLNGAAGEQGSVLPGRDVTLQRRTGSGIWAAVAKGDIGANGLLRFGPYGPGGAPQVAGDYRVRLENWTANGDQVGWFLSAPFDLRLVGRPDAVVGLRTAPYAHSIRLEWTLPADPDRDWIEIYRVAGAAAADPTAAKPGQRIARLPGTSTSYLDSGLSSGWTYKYAVYTVSAEGAYNQVPARDEDTTPAESVGGEG